MALTSTDLDIIGELNLAFIAAVGDRNVPRLDDLFAEDFVSTNPDGSFVTKSQSLKLIPGLPGGSGVAGDNIEIRPMGDDFAVVHCEIAWTNPDGSPGHGRFTDGYRKSDDEWKCVFAPVTTYSPEPGKTPSLL